VGASSEPALVHQAGDELSLNLSNGAAQLMLRGPELQTAQRGSLN